MMSNHFYMNQSKQSFSFSYRKVYGYVAILLIVLLMSWEYQKVDAALHAESIPEESIRLRILANSDAPTDQKVKALVRDQVVEAMNSWITEPLTIEEARKVVQAHEDELHRVIDATLRHNGYSYGFTAELGQVEFPTKMYGQLIYPAGLYEALLITLGNGEGRNWWCVLFPPLCFSDSVSGETSAAGLEVANATSNTDPSAKTAKADADETTTDTAEIEVDFFIVEIFQSIGSFFSSIFG